MLELSEAIARAMEEQHISIRELAQKAHVSKTVVTGIRSGSRKNITLDKLKDLMELLVGAFNKQEVKKTRKAFPAESRSIASSLPYELLPSRCLVQALPIKPGKHFERPMHSLHTQPASTSGTGRRPLSASLTREDNSGCSAITENWQSIQDIVVI